MSRHLCENSAWNGLKGTKVKYSFSNQIHCRGHHPSQLIGDHQICNGVYDCLDRSDETRCLDGNGERLPFSPVRLAMIQLQ